jgi:type IV secretion system protein VirB2
MVMSFLILLPEVALAAPWDGPLQSAIDLLTGTTARLVAILAIIVLGFLAMRGRVDWGVGGSIIGGIVLIFGAAWIADNFIGAVG